MLYGQFEEEVRQEFGSMTKFLDYVGLSRGTYYVCKSRGNIKMLINYKEMFDEVRSVGFVAEKVEDVIGMPLKKEVADEILKRIKNRYGSKNAFCNKNKGIFVTELSNIKNGKIKNVTKKVLDISKALEMDLTKYYNNDTDKGIQK